MQVGLVGAGNMARAMARGWGRPVLCADKDRARAEALAGELGGEAVGSNAELAQRADVVFLCHKPPGLREVAAEVAPHAGVVVSVLGAVGLPELRDAYPQSRVHRTLPSTPVEVRQGVVLRAAESDPGPEVEELLGELGTLVTLPESQMDAAMGLMSNTPAYWALVVEAQVDAGVRRGIPAPMAAELVVQTMAGTAALLKARDHDTLDVRREVTSPGGSTARGLDALERNGLRTAFSDAMDAVLDR